MALEHVHIWQPGTYAKTLVLFHGTGGNERDLLPLAQAIDPHANVMGVRGRSLDEGYPRFFRRLAEGLFDTVDLIEKTNELADFLRDCADRYSFDLSNATAVGFSNGANIAAAGLLLRPQEFQHAILIRAMVPLEPVELPNLVGHRVFVSSGEMDPMVPVQNVNHLVMMLSEAGAEVEHVLLQTGHNLTRRDVEDAAKWYQSAT